MEKSVKKEEELKNKEAGKLKEEDLDKVSGGAGVRKGPSKRPGSNHHHK